MICKHTLQKRNKKDVCVILSVIKGGRPRGSHIARDDSILLRTLQLPIYVAGLRALEMRTLQCK